MAYHMNRAYNADAQGSLIHGWALIRQANHNLKTGSKSDAEVESYEAIGYLNSSSAGITRMGAPGVTGIAMFMDQAMTQLLGIPIPGESQASNATKQHYEHVISVFNNAFYPLSSKNFGSITTQQLRKKYG